MEPFVKWAGGKRQVLNEILSRLPAQYNRYVEPFVGGGALFFALEARTHNPKRINDTNKQLINSYKQIKDNPRTLIKELDKLRAKHDFLIGENGNAESFFYEVRASFNERILLDVLNAKDAAKFIYLNKTCFNGLYRVNSTGKFNVPSGKKKHISLYSLDNILKASNALRKTDITAVDFEEACKYLRKGDFVFFDSPYYDTFDTYQSGGFSEKDHKRLAKLFRKLHARGIYCMLTNSDTPFIRDLYKEFRIDEVPVKRLISCDATTRTGTELIITSNYKFCK